MRKNASTFSPKQRLDGLMNTFPLREASKKMIKMEEKSRSNISRGELGENKVILIEYPLFLKIL